MQQVPLHYAMDMSNYHEEILFKAGERKKRINQLQMPCCQSSGIGPRIEPAPMPTDSQSRKEMQ